MKCGGAELQRELALRRDGVDGDDVVGGLDAQRLDGGEADAAGAEHGQRCRRAARWPG